MSYQNNSLDRAVGIIEAVHQSPSGLRLKDLGEQLGANETTVLRTVRVLERQGLLRRDPKTRIYRLGLRLAELGQSAVRGLDAVESLRPLADGLSERFSVTAHIGLLFDGMVTVVAKSDPRELIVRYSSLGTRMPLHATAAGKAVLAFVGEAGVDQFGLRAPLARYGPYSITDPQDLRAEIAAIRERRFSIEKEEYQPGFACVGSAVSVDGDIYALSLSGPVCADSLIEERGHALSAGMASYIDDHRGFASGIPLL